MEIEKSESGSPSIHESEERVIVDHAIIISGPENDGSRAEIEFVDGMNARIINIESAEGKGGYDEAISDLKNHNYFHAIFSAHSDSKKLNLGKRVSIAKLLRDLNREDAKSENKNEEDSAVTILGCMSGSNIFFSKNRDLEREKEICDSMRPNSVLIVGAGKYEVSEDDDIDLMRRVIPHKSAINIAEECAKFFRTSKIVVKDRDSKVEFYKFNPPKLGKNGDDGIVSVEKYVKHIAREMMEFRIIYETRNGDANSSANRLTAPLQEDQEYYSAKYNELITNPKILYEYIYGDFFNSIREGKMDYLDHYIKFLCASTGSQDLTNFCSSEVDFNLDLNQSVASDKNLYLYFQQKLRGIALSETSSELGEIILSEKVDIRAIDKLLNAGINLNMRCDYDTTPFSTICGFFVKTYPDPKSENVIRHIFQNDNFYLYSGFNSQALDMTVSVEMDDILPREISIGRIGVPVIEDDARSDEAVKDDSDAQMSDGASSYESKQDEINKAQNINEARELIIGFFFDKMQTIFSHDPLTDIDKKILSSLNADNFELMDIEGEGICEIAKKQNKEAFEILQKRKSELDALNPSDAPAVISSAAANYVNSGIEDPRH